MSLHWCGWPGCRERVRLSLWGCSSHWHQLPSLIRARILRAYVPGQGVADHSQEYKDAVAAADAWIRQYHPPKAMP